MWIAAVVVALLACEASARTIETKKDDASLSGTINDIVDGVTQITMADLVLPLGYPLEEHEVTTEDGYILTVFRIPYRRNGTNGTPARGPPVLIQHGLLAASTCWVITEPKKSIGFLLSDLGYDVWFGNSRGNIYSQKHVSLDPVKDKAKFWDFSFHEMGYYDLPAVVDFILKESTYSQVHYIGHSQGTTEFFAFLATRPEYNSKIASMNALAPVAFLNHCRGTARLLASTSTVLNWITNTLGIYEVLESPLFLRLFGQALCQEKEKTQGICDDILFLIAGYDSQQLNATLLPIISNIAPDGTSIKQLVHFAQLIYNDDMYRQYDYGKTENNKLYGSDEPPNYNLTNIQVPVYLHYADNDYLGTTEDVEHLYSIIQHTATLRKVPLEVFNHLDFLWAKDVDTLLYQAVVDIITQIEPKP